MTSDARVGGEVLGDAELIAAARGGESAAFAALYERHAGAALVVARQYSTSVADAEDVVSEAFTKVFSVFQYGGGPDVAFRAYLFTVVRRLAMTRKDGLRRVAPTDDVETFESGLGAAASTEEPAMAGFERSVVSRAYATLPERWQAVLWYTEVESLTPAQIAPLLGLTANGVAALSYRAREGLRQAYLQQHLQAPPTDACRPCADKLGAYVRGGLARRETAQVQEHLDSCADCRALLLELGDVNHGMRTIIAPLVLGLAGLAALAHELPLAGGLAAGAGAVGGGAAAGGAASTGLASGTASTGVIGGAATGAVGAGALTSSAVATGGGLLAFLGALSGGAVAAAVAAVLVVGGVATAALMGAWSAPGTSTGAEPQAGSTSTSTTAARPGAAPTAPITSGPGSVSDSPGLSVAGVPAVDAALPRSTDPSPVPSPEPGPSPQPTSDPTPSSTAGPTVPTTSIQVAAFTPTVTLAAGSTSTVGFTLQNAGASPASDLLAALTLPPGVTLSSTQSGLAIFGGGGRSYRVGTLASPSGWTCATTGGTGSTVTCRLAELPAGQSTVLTVSLSIARTADGGDAEIGLDLSGTGVAATQLRVPAHVTALDAIVGLVAPEDQDVTATEPSALSWVIDNTGGQPARDVTLQLTLPAGLAWDPTVPVSAGWSCTPGGGAGDGGASGLRCTLAALGPDASATLRPTFTAATEALNEPMLPLGYGLSWSSATAPASGVTTLTVVPSPGTLAVDGPSGATFVVGTPHTVTWTVGNPSTSTMRGLDVTVTPPPGVVLAPDAAVDGWACTEGTDGTIDCTRPALDPGATADLALALTATATSLDPPTGVLLVDARRDGSLAMTSFSTTTTQLPSTAVLTIDPIAPARVVVGEQTTVAVSWRNDGGVDAVGAVATVTLPVGVHATVTGGPASTCAPSKPAENGADVWACTYPRTVPGDGGQLTLTLSADPSAHGVTGLAATIAVTAESGAVAAGATMPITVASAVLETQPSAPLVALAAGKTGTLSFTVANTGDADAHGVRAEVDLPAGVDFDATKDGATACTTSDGIGGTTRTVSCPIGYLPAGTTAPVLIGLRAEGAAAANLLLTLSADGLAPVEISVPATIATNGLSPRYTSGATPSTVTEIGAPLLTCATTGATAEKCAKILVGSSSANNNDVTMVPLDAAGGERTSSSATLAIPEGSTVTFAGLYWSANAGPSDSFDGPRTTARLRAPGADSYQTVTGTVLSDLRDNSARHYYQSFADVTDLVAAAGGGTWSVADIAVAKGRSDPSPTYYAGWSLVVVYTGGPSAGNVTVYDGGAWVASNGSVPFAFQGAADHTARLGAVAWEGDQGTSGDKLSLNGTALTPLRWDHTDGSSTNAFDSTATGSGYANSLGVDAKGFVPQPLVDGVNTVVASTSGDQYLIGVLTVTTTGEG